MIFLRLFHILILAVFSWACYAGRTGRALIVGIGTYPVESGWETIHGDNDGRLMIDCLKKNHYDQIVLLENENATKNAIVQAFRDLYEQTKAGDFLFLHFSCHGQQMMDLNGDEEDGLDEALIPYDALFWYIPDVYEGERHLCDDELGEWIERLRHKAGPEGQIFVLLDACHSGSANRYTRGVYVRGSNDVFAPDGYVAKPGRFPERSRILKPSERMAPTLVLSACEPWETNYEYYNRDDGRYYGKLTYGFMLAALQQPGALVADDWLEMTDRHMRKLPSGNLTRIQFPYMECSDEEYLFVLSVAN